MLKIHLSLIMAVFFCLPSYAEDVIVAKVNGTALTQKGLDRELDRLIPQITFHKNVSPEKYLLRYPHKNPILEDI